MKHTVQILSGALFAATLFQAAGASATQGAEVYSVGGFGYGRYETRVQFAPGNGVLSTFFLWKPGSEMADIFWLEVDVEKLGPDCMGYSSNAIYGLPQRNHEEHIDWDSDLCGGYHTHGVDWTPDAIVWTIDGVEVRRLEGEAATAFAENSPDGVNMRFNLWQGDASFGGILDESILPVHQYHTWAQFSEHTPGNGPDGSDFTLSWRDEFDDLGSEWALGTWLSPKNLSTHNPQNATVVDGVLVLSLTADDAVGFTGSPPIDPTEMMPIAETEMDPGGTDGEGASADSGGCSVSATKPRGPHGGGLGAWGLLSMVLGLGLRRRELRRRAPKLDSE